MRYNGQEIALRNLEKNSYATVRLYGGKVVEIDAWPGSVSTGGVIESITYGVPTTLTVRTTTGLATFEIDLNNLPAVYRDDKTTTTGGVIESIAYGSPTTLSVRTGAGQVVTFKIDLNNLPSVYRDDRISSIDKLRTGDSIVVTVRYNQVSSLEATSQSANVTGTITRVLQDASGLTIDVQQTDGSTVTYTVTSSVSVTQDGAILPAYNLKVNDRVAMVVSGGEVVSIEIKDASGNQLSATVLLVNTREGTMMVQLTDGSAITVDVTGAGFVTAAGGSSSLSQLVNGDQVQIYGQYMGGSFKATLVVRL